MAMLSFFCMFIVLSSTEAVLEGTEKDRCVAANNRLRQLHLDTPDLSWDVSLARAAQHWADHLINNNGGNLQHSSTNQGENLYGSRNTRAAVCAEASLDWYKEFNDYSYQTANSKNGKAIGHFTQLVWNPTTLFGVGVATRSLPRGYVQTVIVARYSPRGNSIVIYPRDTYASARLRVYTANVRQRQPNAITPNIGELDPALATPPPSLTCFNINKQCSYFVANYDCTGKYQPFFRIYCRLSCEFCSV